VGTLKTFIGQQFIYTGLKQREPCLYISPSADLKSVEEQVKQNVGRDLQPYLKKKQLRFVDCNALWKDKTLRLSVIQTLK